MSIAPLRSHWLAPSAQLQERGTGVRFVWSAGVEAFAVRVGGEVRAYVNRCPHQGTALDWEPDAFFSEDGAHLVCASHGALFDPQNGLCVAGPCRGARLQALPVIERDGELLRVVDESQHPG